MTEGRNSITFRFPLERPHCGVPLANGNFGALVWGRDTLNLTLGQNDLWDHRIGELVDERDSYERLAAYAEQHEYDSGLNREFHREMSFPGRSRRLPVGRIDFHFAEGIVPRKAELDYETGMLDVETSGNRSVRLICVLKQNILYILDTGGEIRSISLHPASDFPKVRQFNADRGMGEYERIPGGWKIHPPDDPDFTVRAEKTPYGWKIYTNRDGDDSRMQQQIAFTASWWRSFFERTPRITVPDPWWNRFFRFSLYKFGAATCPFGFPSGLQGPWHEEYQPCPWSGDFHFNVNVQMIYGPAFALGTPEHALPLFDMIESPSFLSAMKHNAKALFKAEDALWQTHAVDDRGLQCGGLSCGAVLDPACGAWTALLYYDYYRYTNDVKFLRERAWPYISGIMRGYECMLDTGFDIPLAISAEYASSNRNMKTVAGRNPSYQLAAIRKLALILLECAEVLDLPERPVWRKILEKVPPYTTVSGYDSYSGKNQPRIGIWEGQDLEVCHRHHSHLGCIWPFDSLPEKTDPEMETVLANSIGHWIGMGFGKWSEWGIPWANIIFTRRGLNEAPMQLFGIWKELFVNEGLATVYLPRMLSLMALRWQDVAKPKEDSEIMQLDGTCGFLSAFMEMCACTRFDKVHLFRGMPEKWKEISIENLLLPGGGRLSADRPSGSLRIEGGARRFTPAQK